VNKACHDLMSNLELKLSQWAQHQADFPLSQLEPDVWARIDASRRKPGPSAYHIRAAIAAAMLGLGVAAGGAVSFADEPDASPFALHAAYAPSTLLDGDR
jgi:hypothetical protein